MSVAPDHQEHQVDLELQPDRPVRRFMRRLRGGAASLPASPERDEEVELASPVDDCESQTERDHRIDNLRALVSGYENDYSLPLHVLNRPTIAQLPDDELEQLRARLDAELKGWSRDEEAAQHLLESLDEVLADPEGTTPHSWVPETDDLIQVTDT